MPAQKREPARNYIGLMADDEERRANDSTVTSDRRVQDYFLDLMSAIFRRRGGAG